MRLFYLILIASAVLLHLCAAESNGCFTLEGWKGEEGCTSRLFCDTGSRCNEKTGPLCKFGLYCSAESGTCQPLKPLDANCSAGYDCASGICMEGPQDFPICADASALPCGETSCGPGMYCRQEGEDFQCASPRGGSSAPCDYEVMSCRGGLTCAPDRNAQDGATCTPIYSLPMGSSCANSSTRFDSGAEACELGTFCSGGVCTPYEDVTNCASAADCNFPMGYCKCFSEGSRCVPFRNPACKESMEDLAQCMAARNCNFDNDVEAWAFPTQASCVNLHCSAQYQAAACCLSQTSRGLEGSGSALKSPLGASCGNSVVSGYLVAFIIVVVLAFFGIIAYIFYRQFVRRSQSQYSQLSTVDPWDDDASQWGFESSGDVAATELAPSDYGKKRAAFMRPDSF